MLRQLDLTGWWWADRDRALYYIRHLDDNNIWWAGVRGWWGSHQGLEYTNVFHGVVDPATKTIEGVWADVPRGGNLNYGRLSLEIAEIVEPERFVGSPNQPFIPPDGPPDDGLPPQSRFELRQKSEGTTGGFGNYVWRKTLPIVPPSIHYIEFLFSKVKDYGGGGVLGDRLIPYRDRAVVWGHIGPMGQGYGIGWHIQPRDYCHFIRGEGGGDGDTSFHLDLGIPDRRDLDTQPDFWVQSSGWLRPAANILAKLNLNNRFHTEVIMFGREDDEDHCGDSHGGLLPGWMQTGGFSVLVNGLPINGNVFWVQDHIEMAIVHPDGAIQQVKLLPGSYVRVTGVIVLDTNHDDLLELHPVYSIDLQQTFFNPGRLRSGADLTGVWHANDVGTYYLRQLDGNTVWWLGLSQDQGKTFANVFHGTIEDDTISGEWSDIPIGVAAARSSGRLTLVGNGPGQLATTLTVVERTGGFGGSVWRKLYDRPFPRISRE